MRFLADENIPGRAVSRLTQEGHDVIWMCDVAPGSPDAALMERARIEQRIILTFDKDFGEWVFHHRQETWGVILFRMTVPLDLEAMIEWIIRVIRSRIDWEGHFSTATPDYRLRMRPLQREV